MKWMILFGILFAGRGVAAFAPQCQSIITSLNGAVSAAYADYSQDLALRLGKRSEVVAQSPASSLTCALDMDAWIKEIDDSHVSVVYRSARGLVHFTRQGIRTGSTSGSRNRLEDEPSVISIGEIVIFRIPSFRFEHAPKIAAAVQLAEKRQSGKSALILDLRGNAGGHSATYAPLLGRLINHKISIHPFEYRVGGRAAQASIDTKRHWAEWFHEGKFSPFDASLLDFEASQLKIGSTTYKTLYPRFEIDPVENSPLASLTKYLFVDSRCASACLLFVQQLITGCEQCWVIGDFTPPTRVNGEVRLLRISDEYSILVPIARQPTEISKTLHQEISSRFQSFDVTASEDDLLDFLIKRARSHEGDQADPTVHDQ